MGPGRCLCLSLAILFLLFPASRGLNVALASNAASPADQQQTGGDQWQIARHLTVNIGLRFDDFATYIPGQNKPAGAFGPPGSRPPAARTSSPAERNNSPGLAPVPGAMLPLVSASLGILPGIAKPF
jgi:hypothetical protein